MSARIAPVISLADVKLAASTSFSAAEVDLLDQLLAILRRGGTVPTGLGKSEAARSLLGKLPAMRAQIARNRERRAAMGKR